ncbi:MAG: tetratricopeptide repeat protein [Alphaproteobacteria bacterium]|nr:tetratricopeptide repeat protein [Alphaproteobacteria bacterium]
MFINASAFLAWPTSSWGIEGGYYDDPGLIQEAYNPQQANVLNDQAIAADERGDFHEAIRLYKEALALDPNNAVIQRNMAYPYNMLGNEAYESGEYETAVTYYREAVAKKPSSEVIRENLESAEDQVRWEKQAEEKKRRMEEAKGRIVNMLDDFVGELGSSGPGDGNLGVLSLDKLPAKVPLARKKPPPKSNPALAPKAAPRTPVIAANDTMPPTIHMPSSITVKSDSPTVQGKVSDNEKVALLTVEGRAVEVGADGSFSFTRYVPGGGTSVRIEAIDEWGNRSEKVVSLSRRTVQTAALPFAPLDPTVLTAKRNGDAVALIIGVANYKRTPQAMFADRDAEFFRDYAKRMLGVPDGNIKVLTNENADMADIIEATNIWLPGVVMPNSSDVYVFFAGHGLASEDGGEVYLLPFGGIPRVLGKTAVLRSELFKTVASVQPRSVTVFLDTCYSGTSRTEETLLASRPVVLVAKEQDVPKGFMVFSAASMEQTAKMLPEAKHGLFSYWLMKGMEGPADANKDHKITTGELHRYVLANVSRFQQNQTPELQGDTDRVLVQW